MRRRVQQLLRRHPPRRVAETTGVSLSSVKRIAKEPRVRSTDDAAERKRRGLGRPSKLEKHRRLVEQLLDRAPDLPTAEIFRRLRKAGFRGSSSAVYQFVAEIRE